MNRTAPPPSDLRNAAKRAEKRNFTGSGACCKRAAKITKPGYSERHGLDPENRGNPAKMAGRTGRSREAAPVLRPERERPDACSKPEKSGPALFQAEENPGLLAGGK